MCSNSCKNMTPTDVEPKLKYSRMKNDIIDILRKHAASCICVHTKFICIGTQSGPVHLLDHDGNNVPIGTANDRKQLQVHNMAVNQISVDRSGEYIATCSDDGKAVVYCLYSGEYNQTITLTNEIKSIALDLLYSQSGSSLKFFTGDTKLTMNERSVMIPLRKHSLYKTKGYVQNICWQGRFVAWAGDFGVRVHDLVPKCSLGLIKWYTDVPFATQDYRCNLKWAAEKTLMIGWVDIVKICLIRKSEVKDALKYSIHIMYTFQTDFFICGLGPLGERLVLLGLPKDKDSVTGKSQEPFLCIADYQGREFKEVSRDSLDICVYEEYSCKDYQLDQLIEENRFSIVSPKAVLVARPYDVDDRVKWFMENGKYEKAVSFLEKSGGKTKKHSVSDVGIPYLDYLLDKKSFKDAAIVCAKVCRNDGARWENHILKFHKLNQLHVIIRYFPKTLTNKLPSVVQEMILNEYLESDPKGFLSIVQSWDPTLYNATVMRDNVISHFMLTSNSNKANNEYILEALAILYCYEKKYEESIKLYLKLKRKDIFTIIRKFNMYSGVHEKILALMKLDCDETISILLENCKVSPDTVEEQLKGNDNYLFRYFDAYSNVDSEGLHQGKLVRLYAKYAREKLMPLLRYGKYNIEEALEVCDSNNLYPEKAYLMGKSGNTKKALQIMLEKLCDIDQAICFCQEHNDKELWIDLVNYSVDKPEYVNLLLREVGKFADPTILIKRIKPKTEILNLKDSLTKMMYDCNFQLSVQQTNKAITLQMYSELHNKLVRKQNRCISIGDELVCSACHGKILLNDDNLSDVSPLRVYNCHHLYHIGCLPDNLQRFILCHQNQ